ncbi:MAG TPA: DUF4124 domain-containing protein [Gammaproteobacteria bacterium]
MKPVLLIFFMLLCTNAMAEIYKWTDEQGNVHYSDKPVKEDAQQMEIKTEWATQPRVSEQERQERRQRLLQAYDEDRAKQKEIDDKEQKQKDKLKRDCVIARDRLARYEKSRGLYDFDKDGNRIILEDKERQRITDSLRQQINQNCK